MVCNRPPSWRWVSLSGIISALALHRLAAWLLLLLSLQLSLAGCASHPSPLAAERSPWAVSTASPMGASDRPPSPTGIPVRWLVAAVAGSPSPTTIVLGEPTPIVAALVEAATRPSVIEGSDAVRASTFTPVPSPRPPSVTVLSVPPTAAPEAQASPSPPPTRGMEIAEASPSPTATRAQINVAAPTDTPLFWARPRPTVTLAPSPTSTSIFAFPNSVPPLSVSDCPESHPIKGNISSSGEKIYHVPGGASYRQTHPEACFATEADAQAAGFRRARR